MTALELVLAGAPLRMVAATLQLPLWLKPLSVDAVVFMRFSTYLGQIPDSPDFHRAISNHLPVNATNEANELTEARMKSVNYEGAWLELILGAAKYCSEEFALWLAKQLETPAKEFGQENYSRLLGWAWYCQSENCVHAEAQFLSKEWHPEMSLRTAMQSARDWLDRLKQQDENISQLNSYSPVSIGDYSFVLLQSKEDFSRQGKIMGNWVVPYIE